MNFCEDELGLISRSIESRSCHILTVELKLLFLTVFAVWVFSAEIVYTDRHLVQYDNGVVYDTKSGLEWFAEPDRSTSWEEADRWVVGLDKFGGGWRMPILSELDSLCHMGDGVNNITYLLTDAGYWIWAGKTLNSSSKWIFSFSYGGEGWNGQPPDNDGRALAVRQRTRY
jgi:hypothetical protein